MTQTVSVPDSLLEPRYHLQPWVCCWWLGESLCEHIVAHLSYCLNKVWFMTQTPLLFRPHPCSNEGPSHGLQSFRINLHHGVFTGYSVDIGSDVFSPWAAGKYLLHPGLLQNFHRLQRNIFLKCCLPLLLLWPHNHKTVFHTLRIFPHSSHTAVWHFALS